MTFDSRVFVLSAALTIRLFAADGETRADWPGYGGSQSAWRYSALSQIDTANVNRLAPVWIFQTGDYRENLQSTPVVVDGTMYIITPHLRVFALNAATGAVLWRYDYGTPRRQRAGGMAFAQNRGVAVSDGKVFFGTTDSYLVALDKKTGHQIWKVAVDDVSQCGCDITAAPLVVRDKVVVGGTGGDAAHRGYLTAFNARTGRFAWRWYAIPGPGEAGHETWKGDSWKFGGGAPWMTGSYDPELNLIYWGTGNPSGDFFAEDREVTSGAAKVSNLFTSSVVALDADTGKLRWYRQEIPGDLWDFDSVYECILIDRAVDGRMRKLLVHMNKSGLIFVLDRLTGEVVQAFSPLEVQTWISGVSKDGELIGRKAPERNKVTTVCPGPAGAKGWNSMAYSPQTGLVYAPINELCAEMTAALEPVQEGRFRQNGSFVTKLPPNRASYSHLDAWDPATGARAWSMPYRYVLLASVLATGGGLIFTGNPEGEFFAADAKTGRKLWTYQTGAGHRGSSISYSVNGRQYVATPTGWQQTIEGAQFSALFPGQEFRAGSTLIAFALQ